MTRLWRLITMMCITLLSLTACDSESRYEDLDQQMKAYLKKVKAETEKIDTAEIPPIKEAKYQRRSTRSPFASESSISKETKQTGQGLTDYSSSAIRFVGMLEAGGKTTAILETPDKKIYEVMKGDRVGNGHGKISEIYPDRLEIHEPISKDDPSLGDRKIVLKLKDAR